MKRNPNVCFEMDIPMGVKTASAAQGHSFYYQSIIGWGKVEFIEEASPKRRALLQIMKHMTGVSVFRVVSSEFTGKEHLRED